MAFNPPGGAGSAPSDSAALELSAFSRDVHLQMEKTVEDVIVNISKSRAFFREDDIIKGVLRKSQKEFHPEVVENDDFERLIRHYVDLRPLVKIGATGNITTPEMVELERKMIAHAGADDGRFVLPENVVRGAIARKTGISDEQTRAVEAACLSARRVTVIEGTAGAGKSFTMEAVKESYQEMGYTIMGAALSWNAAQVLGASIKLDGCMAIESLMQSLREARASGTDFFRTPTLLIVDEAGMVGTNHMATILEETSRSNVPVKVVLTGDSLQVNPVDAGNALQAIVAFHGTTRIDTIRRQKQDSHRRAIKRFSRRESGKALYPFLHQEAVHWCRDQEEVFNKVVQDFVSYRHSQRNEERPKTALVLALSNKDVVELNRRIRSIYKRLGLVEAREVEVDVTDGREIWKAGFSVGDEVVLRATGKEMIVYEIDKSAPVDDETTWTPIRKGVYNRNAGKVVAIRRSSDPVGSYDFVVDLGGDTPGRVIVNSQKYKHREKQQMSMVHNFATTIYGSQGQTVDQVFLIDSPMMEFRLAYVGMSRHREHVEVYLNETELHSRMDKMLGKVAPLAGRGSDPNAPPEVEIGRYKRSEMLQTVARSWGKLSLNLTAMMFDRQKRLGEDRVNRNQEEQRTLIRAEDGEDNLDFIPSINVRMPKLDIEAIMALPEPKATAALPRGPRAASAGPVQTAVRLQYDPNASFEIPTVSRTSVLQQPDLFKSLDPFAPVRETPAPAQIQKQEVAQQSGVLYVPLADPPAAVGKIDENGVLCFDGVPQPQVPAGEVMEVSASFLLSAKGHFWAEGRYKEPRILARDHTGQIAARYRLDGQCVVGEGFPPMMLNHAPSLETPIMIVPGAKEFFLVGETMRKKHASAPEKVPHLIWAAKDADWGLIAQDMKDQKIFIVRSKHDPSQAQWAQALERELRERWGVHTTVVPRLDPPSPSRRSP